MADNAEDTERDDAGAGAKISGGGGHISAYIYAIAALGLLCQIPEPDQDRSEWSSSI